MELSVITHTRFTNLKWLEECKASVALALPPGIEHQIIPAHRNWAELRLEAVTSNKYVALIDDDDVLIDPRAISLCVQALEETGAGIAFTNECTSNENLECVNPVKDRIKSYEKVRTSPREIHHILVYRADAIDPIALKLHHEQGFGIDWFLVCSAALNHGAIYVPIDAYIWRQHKNSMTRAHKLWASQVRTMTQRVNETWPVNPKYSGVIPRYDIPL